MIRNHIAQLTYNAIKVAQQAGDLPNFDIPQVIIERPQKSEWGDFSSSLPLKLASVAKRAPLQIAQTIAKHVPADPALGRVDAVAPGFVNFTLGTEWLATQVKTIRDAGAGFGNVDVGGGKRVQVEFVSANPTGPLTIGSARNAAIGDTIVRILRATSYDVATEYYVNDAGSQVRHFGESIYVRYAQQLGRDEPFPEKGYKGEYVAEIAREIATREGEKYLSMPRAEAIRALGRIGIDQLMPHARETLRRMRVEIDSWFFEKSLYDSGLFDQVYGVLKEKGLVYEEGNAKFFDGTRFGLEKGAVLIRSPQVTPDPSERPTYLASDVAYVWNKLVVRGFEQAIYVWGADHQGDVPRVMAVAQALDLDPKRLTILIYQLVRLTRGGEKVRMSKRAGEFDTLADLIDEVGADAVRFLLITRSADSPMDFDLQLAKEQSDQNPVYYVQYMHARIAGILRNAAERGFNSEGSNNVLLEHPAELGLIRQMLRFEEVVELAAMRLEPHHLPHYALELARTFSVFYDQCRVLSNDPAELEISRARLTLVSAAKQVLARALDLMGVSAPDTM